jgi:hypothetical protein
MDKEKIFKAAVEIAIRRQIISSPDKVDFEQSYKSSDGKKGYFLLRNSQRKTLAKIDNDSIEKQMSGKVPEILKASKPVAEKKITYVPKETKKVSSEFPMSNDAAAVAWAKSIGYPVPTKMNGCLTGVLVLIGLTAFVIPGVLILVFVFIQNRTYERDMKALVIKWVDAGKPMPGEKVKSVEKLEKIKETKVERITEKTEPEDKKLDGKEFETKLQELNSMKEKGLISEEEFQQLRKKALGL